MRPKETKEIKLKSGATLIFEYTSEDEEYVSPEFTTCEYKKVQESPPVENLIKWHKKMSELLFGSPKKRAERY